MTDPNDPTELPPLLEGFQRAIDEEVLAIEQDLARRGLDEPVVAAGGHEADVDASGSAYDWTLPPGRYAIRTDDAVRVVCRDSEAQGFVGRWEPSTRTVRVHLPESLGKLAGPAELRFDPTWLLSALAGRLSSIGSDPEAYHTETALSLFGMRYPETGHRAVPEAREDGLNEGQRGALGRILGSRVQLVWGPPGTGKTLLLGRATGELARDGRVLVAATTNAAVDQAARRIAEGMGTAAVADGRILRVGAGYRPDPELDLSLEAVLARQEERDPGRFTRLLVELEQELGLRPDRSPAMSPSRRYGVVLARARVAGSTGALSRAGLILGELQRARARLLARADVIATTFAHLTLREDLWAQRFHSFVVDEASAAPLPYVFAGACLASDRAVAVGDFQQLPAVVRSRDGEAARWLGRDIFRQTGAIDPESGRNLPDPHDGLCAMLTEQYRMVPEIRQLVSGLYYGGRLKDAPSVTSGRSGLAPLVLVDTSSLRPVVEREEGSRANAAHVETLVRLLELLGRSGVSDVGVVTPYRLQSRRIFQQVRSRLGRSAPRDLEIATIHRFQGREKTAVIVDTVDGPPGASWFLNERRNADFPRLLNVAISRSRDALILIGSPDGLRRVLPENALLVRVLEAIRGDGVTLEASRLAGAASRLWRT
jgi:hypothetical protein